jgi:hypothetical protein
MTPRKEVEKPTSPDWSAKLQSAATTLGAGAFFATAAIAIGRMFEKNTDPTVVMTGLGALVALGFLTIVYAIITRPK